MEEIQVDNKYYSKIVKTFFDRVSKLEFPYIEILTTPTGILQHAKFNIPNYHHGYCLDDNCRALLLFCKAYHQLEPSYRNKSISNFLGFIHYAQKEDASFTDFIHFHLPFTAHIASDDSIRRTISALGFLLSKKEIANHHPIAKELFDRSSPHVADCNSARAVGSQILGLLH